MTDGMTGNRQIEPLDQTATEIAWEHVRWARQTGLTPGDVMESIGLEILPMLYWPEVAQYLEMAWLK